MGLKGSVPFSMSIKLCYKTMNPKASFVFIHGSDVKASFPLQPYRNVSWHFLLCRSHYFHSGSQETKKYATLRYDTMWKTDFKVIPQFCIANFYCAHPITYNFIHCIYTVLKNHFMTILCYFKTSLVTFCKELR